MPIRINRATEQIVLKDDDGTPMPDCTVTIRAKLSHDAITEYNQNIARVYLLPDGTISSHDVNFRGAEEALFNHGVVEWTGIQDDGGMALPLDRWRELPTEICKQIIDPLQAKTVKAKKDKEKGSDPNSGTPSSESLKAEQGLETTTVTPMPLQSASGLPAS